MKHAHLSTLLPHLESGEKIPPAGGKHTVMPLCLSGDDEIGLGQANSLSEGTAIW